METPRRRGKDSKSSKSRKTPSHFLSSQMHTPKDDVDSPLPPISQRLAHLRPSRELLEFYRRKVAEFDSEHEDMLRVLDTYKATYEEQHKLQWELRQREGEIAELQKALSDMQVYLFQEREHALRLYAENDRLKIREIEDRKKIQHLLLLVGPDIEEITYFHKEPPHKVTIPQKKALHSDTSKHAEFRSARSALRKSTSKTVTGSENLVTPERYVKDNQTLLLQVEALQAQMEEQTKLAKEQVESLLEDRRIRMEETQVQQQRDQEKIATLTEKLHRTQTLLYDSTKDYLQLKFDGRAIEKNWMSEKDQLLQELDTCHTRLQETRESVRTDFHIASSVETESHQVCNEDIKSLEEQVKQAHQMANMYREQCVSLENELAQIREEGDVGREIFKERSDKMAKRLQLMTTRYEALEKRRAMEVEGFKNDIKLLRQRLKDLEKQLFKVTLNVGPDQDLAILHEVRQSNFRTKKIQGQLKSLKAKIYGFENELRYC
ncbi:coiled-coil domain-containing protein 77 [Polypterus senegalus]|uniref:coiled-coil domain-containing protein 77 n=1 Tax=Polypterus senegalus TaxID=55291 RepID=UPI001965338E|nr:coiled-coil domain-containing protein 77 [Polypterus senegalus]XP_039616602.1 coiled-coil domain-containing protein 77 [Polypterus senegalus]XP_039616603.1 coiled-coil domain-containing protein 77 [Polypterus senegalus]